MSQVFAPLDNGSFKGLFWIISSLFLASADMAERIHDSYALSLKIVFLATEYFDLLILSRNWQKVV